MKTVDQLKFQAITDQLGYKEYAACPVYQMTNYYTMATTNQVQGM